MSDGNGGAPGGDAGQGDGQGEAGGFDAGAITSQLESLTQGQEQLRQYMTGLPDALQQQMAPPAQEEEGFDPNAPIDLSFLDEQGYDTTGAEQLMGPIQQHMQQMLEARDQQWEQRLSRIDNRVSEREQIEQLRDLVTEFPDLQDSGTAEEAFQMTQQYVQAHGMPAELASNVGVVRLVYMAQQAAQAANDEGAEPSDTAHLEGGGGAGASQSGSSAQDFAQMLQGERRDGPILPY